MCAKKQILFVDDDDLILSCFERLFAKRFTMETASGAAQAMEALKDSSFAVVATDMRMPGMNGIELLRKIKERNPETVGILLTGNPESDSTGNSGADTPCYKVLSKPCPTEDLIAAIEESLEQYRLNTQVGAE
jgi:DNA-binding NtrC family response regulator